MAPALRFGPPPGMLVVLASVVGLACDPAPATAVSSDQRPLPRPTNCREIAPGTPLQPLLDKAAAGDALCLADGTFRGPVALRQGITIWGSRRAVIRSSGRGTTVKLAGAHAALLGLTVDGSGGRYDLLDAAVHVTADDARVEGVQVKNAVFGLLVEKTHRVLLKHNEVLGPDRGPLGLRGDGIRLWETRDSLIEGNRVSGSRDLVVWYSPGNRLVGNRVERGRYGTHFMYSHDNAVEGNHYVDNVVGVFVMYSRNIRLHDNLLARSHGAGGMGLGLKESGNLTVTDNRFLLDTVGIYLDTSPLQPEDHNIFSRNELRLADKAVVFHSSPQRNTFSANRFADNRIQVEVAGGGDATGITWQGNDFDDYAGYDLDGDGLGDVPYRLQSLSGTLRARYPALAFFSGSLTLAALDAVARIFPLLQPKTILVDPRPRISRSARRDTAGAGLCEGSSAKRCRPKPRASMIRRGVAPRIEASVPRRQVSRRAPGTGADNEG